MYIPLKLPPGVFRNGTEYQAAGRWYDANLVRWYENTLRPMGGWRKRATGQMTGLCRGFLTWRDNDGDRWISAGTQSKLYAMNEAGTLKDITPTGLTVGIADAVSKTGYGYSTYGSLAYGTARPDTGTITPATTWSMDTWGEYLVACSNADGKLYEWQLGFTTPTRLRATKHYWSRKSAFSLPLARVVIHARCSGATKRIIPSGHRQATIWQATMSWPRLAH